MPKPFFNDLFHIPDNTYFDACLISRSAIFGVEWGLGAFGIGPAVMALLIVATEITNFVVMIITEIVTVKYFGL